MKLADFDFHLPGELIARYPLAVRSASRLLYLHRDSGQVEHRTITELPQLLHPKDLLIFNDTKVMPARLRARKKTGGKIEILVERILEGQQVLAQMRGAQGFKPGTLLLLENNLTIEVIGRQADHWQLQFNTAEPIAELLEKIGEIPLPPYLQRPAETLDQERYQTVFAKELGAIAAPTAGLHFDEMLIQALKQKNIAMDFVTLHVGAGTFQPVRVENIHEHQMHPEYCVLSAKVADKIKQCQQQGGRVIAVGTTAMRTLESAAQGGEIKPYQGETRIFIYPGYHFNCVNGLITNFHLPKSTLLMLVCAFAGYSQTMAAYQQAIAQRYRFFSYGDAMLIV